MAKAKISELTVLGPGSPVRLCGGRIDAIVVGVMLEGPELHLSYQCAWWNGSERCVQWCVADEVDGPKAHHLVRLGFAAPG